MNFEVFLFYLFSSMAMVSAVIVIEAENPMYSVLFLMIVFSCFTGLLVLLEVEFLAMLFLVVYVGAIAVLFLFVVMMLNINVSNSNTVFLYNFSLGFVLTILFLVQFSIFLSADFMVFFNAVKLAGFLEGYFNCFIVLWPSIFSVLSNVESLGNLLYTTFFHWFIMASLMLLVAMVGTIILTLQKYAVVHKQNIFVQVNSDFSDVVFLWDN